MKELTAEVYRPLGFWRKLWRFVRPHSIIATTVSLLCLWLMAKGLFPENSVFGNASDALGIPKVVDLKTLLITWGACVMANVYIVGLNQLSDVQLDKINKPHLPLASGAWPMRMGTLIVWSSLILAIVFTAWVGSMWLWWALGLSVAIGTAYSLPPLRLKRFSYWAAFSVVAIRSFIVNLLLLAHLSGWSSDIRDMQPYVWLLVAVMLAFSLALTWMKGIPNTLGDKAHGIATLATELGPEKVMQRVRAVMIFTLSVSVVAGWFFFEDIYLVGGQLVMLGLFIALMLQVDLAEPISLRRFYVGFWVLYALEYVVFAGVAWLG